MIWHLYFAAKLLLGAEGYLQLQVWLNFPLALLVYWPLTRPRWRRLRALLAGPAALVLVIHEAGVNLSGRLLQQVGQLSGFSSSYALELGFRLLEVNALPALLIVLLACLWLNRWVRLEVLLSLALLSLPLAGILQHAVEFTSSRVEARTTMPDAQAQDPQTKVQDFWQNERQRSRPFATGRQPPFDVVLLHVCSLSWDDLDAVGPGGRQLFDRFDLVFDQFNSVTSYSGPAMLRLMRANCGQTPHDNLYKPAPEQCGLLHQLRLAGYQVQAYLNHDGQFDGFAKALQAETTARILTPVTSQGTPVALRAFDGTPIAGDHATLATWQTALGSSGPPQALYYNTVTLHDGNRVPGAPAIGMMDSYRQRLGSLLRDVDRFIGDIERFLAHEVNGPLSVIQGYARAQALCLGAFSTMPPPAGPLKMALEATERSARHCQTLMTWAAETAKCASHGHEPLTPLASEVLERMLQSYPFAGEEKRWVFVDVERDARLPAKTELLRLTLVTLMRQALDALQGVAQPCLKISLCVREDTHCIRFSHNGRRPPEKFHEALAAGRFQAWGGPGTAFVFCQRAMRSIQGDVRIVLGAGKETSVLLCFGPVDEKLADPRKRDLALRLSP